jgi:hypothetical protein
MPLLKIDATHSEGRLYLNCELYYGTGESAKSVTIQTSLAVPVSYVPEDEFYKREISAIADALVKARISHR